MKKLLLIIALIGIVVLTAYGALSGTYTTNGYFYLPGYGSYGVAEWEEYNTYMQIADTQIEANKNAISDENIQDVAGGMFTGNTETFITNTYQDADGTVDSVVPVKDEDDMASNSDTFLATQQSIKAYADTLHALQYLKTEIDTQAEVETIWGVTLATDSELAALTYSDVGAQQADDALTSLSGLTYVSPSFIELTANDTYTVRTLSETKTDLDVDDLENVTNAMDSSGIVTGGVVSEGTNAGTFKVTAITEAYLRTSASATAPLVFVTLAEQDDQTITAADTTYFVVFTYGTPCTITLSETAPNGYNAIPLGKVMKDGSDNVHYIDGGFRFGDGVRKLHQRAKTLRALELESGSAIEYSGTNNFTMGTGIVYGGLNDFSLTAYNSATTQFTYVYDDGAGGWTETGSNVIDFAHYDDGDGTLGNVGNNRYSVHYVYKHIDDEDVYVVYGTDSYTLAEAEVAAIIPPTVPSHLADFGCQIGTIIAPQSGGSFTAVIMVTSQFFSGTEVVNHNNLGGLQGGTAGEEYHLTEAQHTLVIDNVKYSKFDATQAPTVNNDIDEGYVVGSRWVDVTNDKEYVCLDNTDGAAVWTETTGAGGGASTFTGLTDTPSAYTDKAGKTLKVNSTPDAVEFANDTNVTTKTTTATLTVAEQGTILVSASSAYTITLPTPIGNTGLTYHFKKTDFNYNLITVATTAGQFNYENADSALKDTYPRLNTGGAEATFVSDGSNWQVISEALGQVPECWVWLSANQENIKDNTHIRIELDTEEYDIGSNFDVSNWVTGTADGTVANHLQDDTASQFTALMATYFVRVKNTTDSTYTYVTAYNDAGDLTLKEDIFESGEGYQIQHSQFIVPVDGTYQIEANLNFTNVVADKRYNLYVMKNNAGIYSARFHSSLVSDIGNLANIQASLDKDDVLWFKSYMGVGADTVDIRFGKDNTYMKIRLISKD